MSVQAPASHRDRLMAGMAAAVAEKGGLAGTTVADVVRHARTSRRTFYEHFEDRDACYLALFDAAIDAQMATVSAAVRPGAITVQLEGLVAAWIDTLVATDLTTSFIRDVPALGHGGVQRQHDALERFAALIVSLSEDREDVERFSPDMAIAVVAGLRELVVQALERRRDLTELQPVAVRLLRAVAGA